MLLFCQKALADVDSTYIQRFPQQLSAQTYVAKNFIFLHHDNEDLGISREYMPNNPVSLGLGVTWKNYSFSFGYGFDFMRDKKKGKTKSIDFQYHYYGRKFIFDIFYQDYKGFYDEVSDEKYVLYPDLHLKQISVHAQYVFNHRKFSYRAAFNQSEIQRISAGSFQAGGGINYSYINSDSTLIFENNPKRRILQVGISGGYAYNWVFGKGFYLSGGITVGANFGSDNIKHSFRKIEVSPTAFPRVSAGYNARSWSLRFSFLGNMISFQDIDKKEVNQLNGSFMMSYIHRFNSYPGVMKTVDKIMDKLPF
ncbi:hypothetical protein M2132_001856 [Dysgonomonas sp. PH5-45]|nr:DUF4421 domain-containing protein [Dysgonomonas sp. PH5-45]MDH6355511.1 hypothetical protein [Dysgonomonas sp. PH5-45]